MSIMGNLATIAENIPKVYESGKTSGAYETSLAHWNAISCNGKRTNWSGSDGYSPFSQADYSNIKFPKPIVMVGKVDRTFRMYKGEYLPRKEDIDMSGVTSVNSTFSFIYGVACRTIPDYGIPAMDTYPSTYNSAQDVFTIETVRCHENTTFPNTFADMRNLKRVMFEGVIGTDIGFPNSPLIADAQKHIISHLKDYSGTSSEYTYTVTFKATAFTALEAEGATAEYNGVACTWAELIDNKKWKLTKA